MADFLIAYKRSAVHEGGWCDVPGDRGKETYKGIARAFHPKWAGWKIIDAWKKKNGRPKHNQVIKDHELDELVLAFYRKNFWDEIWGDQIRFQEYANELYDAAVNYNPDKAIALQEQNLKWKVTGTMTTQLLDHINNRHATA